MINRTRTRGSELFIVDNSDTDWKVLQYLQEWCELSERIDIATGYFEIGALLALKDEWQKVDQIRLLMGDEVSKRTKKAFDGAIQALAKRLDDSIESEKQTNDFLTGVPAIVEAIKSNQILCRVYQKNKFHAKAYITHARQEVIGSFALVGSSNFTHPGLSKNIELNVRFGGTDVEVLQDWYEGHWEDATCIQDAILQTIERQIETHSPFTVYAKSLYELFSRHETTAGEWERHESKVFKVLAQYQREGYARMLKIAKQYGGAFLCDGVGLGKTFIGLMLIERLITHDRKKVALFVPKSAKESVWQVALEKYLPNIFGKYSQLEVFSHTDLLRKGKYPKELEDVKERADVIIIDEAHHFRNTGTKGDNPEERKSRYWQMYDICENKQVYMLTATPINNRLTDLMHLTELFSRGQSDYFKEAPLGIHSLKGHFRKLDKALDDATSEEPIDENIGHDTDQSEAEQLLANDALFKSLVVQRSRMYVKESMKTEGDGDVLFPEPRAPKVQPYSVKQTYGKLLKMIEDAFDKKQPLFSLSIYCPYNFYIGDDDSIDPMVLGRQTQVVALIRTGFLKRFESSASSFEMSCRSLLLKLMAWLQIHIETQKEKEKFEKWKIRHKNLIGYVHQKQFDLFGTSSDEDCEEDVIPIEFLDAADKRKLDRDNFEVHEIMEDVYSDLDQLTTFLNELEKFQPKQDKKLTALIKLLKTDKVLKDHKVIIFTEFMTTARYLKQQLVEAGIEGVDEIDSATKGKRIDVIKRFSPYYNDSSSAQLMTEGHKEIRVLVSTDVLSEGLNLQDATRLINYDLHWNPVRLMQRIGRTDRRMNPEIEAAILKDHPDQKDIRGTVGYWNFLPPDELESLLKLYKRVNNKTLKISKTLGIEGKKLLKESDDFDDLKNFTEKYNGKLSPIESMHLELQHLLKDHPDLEQKLKELPGRVFSGKNHPKPNTQAIFFCYARPAKDTNASTKAGSNVWTLDAGDTQWYLYNLASKKILEAPSVIVDTIRCQPDTPRQCNMKQQALVDIRLEIDKHIKNTYLKSVQAPINAPKPKLLAWMELN